MGSLVTLATGLMGKARTDQFAAKLISLGVAGAALTLVLLLLQLGT